MILLSSSTGIPHTVFDYSEKLRVFGKSEKKILTQDREKALGAVTEIMCKKFSKIVGEFSKKHFGRKLTFKCIGKCFL